MLTIFALQDSFGTACNVTGDGAIALMLTGIFKRRRRKKLVKNTIKTAIIIIGAVLFCYDGYKRI